DNINNNNMINDILQVDARVRYRHRGGRAELRMWSPTEGTVSFRDPQRAITPGQAVVFYSGDRVLGGGWIKEVLPQ
ncbi:MAG TPA: aminomethyltransferase beta-barrel domain-containing protein, partial [Thermodesulfobacteriota bacterium]|nr:aminomethyltransferase beta-barrel domain-containing protein [Thermodesulfobacteriota bacterium]